MNVASSGGGRPPPAALSDDKAIERFDLVRAARVATTCVTCDANQTLSKFSDRFQRQRAKVDRIGSRRHHVVWISAEDAPIGSVDHDERRIIGARNLR